MRTFLAALCLAFAACAGGADPTSSLVDTELDFAYVADHLGMNAAFQKFLDKDSILFRPHPIDGLKATADRDDDPLPMSWHPTRAGVSGAGDLGYTTGPYELRLDDSGEPPLYGYFVTVWKRQGDGGWKILIDLGTENPPNESCHESPDFTRRATSAAAEDAGTTGPGELLGLDASLSVLAATDGLPAAFDGYLADDARVYRDGACPAEGRSAAQALLQAQAATVRWVPIDAIVANSGDLGYSYGSYERLDDSSGRPERGYYVRVWRREAGDWMLALDVTSPVIEDAEPAAAD